VGREHDFQMPSDRRPSSCLWPTLKLPMSLHLGYMSHPAQRRNADRSTSTVSSGRATPPRVFQRPSVRPAVELLISDSSKSGGRRVRLAKRSSDELIWITAAVPARAQSDQAWTDALEGPAALLTPRPRRPILSAVKSEHREYRRGRRLDHA
jgi:hypothetical protein